MIKIILGNKSNGEAIIVDLILLSNLFVSYVSNNQFTKLYGKIVNSNKAFNYLLIGKADNVFDSTGFTNIETYTYDDPVNGSITNKKELFNGINRALERLRRLGRKINPIQLIIIDDIFLLAAKLDKRGMQQFKNLLNYGSAVGIHFIIGSVLPYRNLLKQLMVEQSSESRIKTSPINELGAEIIFNSDGLIFFREKNIVEYTILYPISDEKKYSNYE